MSRTHACAPRSSGGTDSDDHRLVWRGQFVAARYAFDDLQREGVGRVELRRFPDARDFLDRAGSWLMQREAEHNLVLGLTRQLIDGDHAFVEPIYFASVEDTGKVVGCAFRTPPFKLGLTRCPLSAMPLLVEDVAAVYTKLPAVMGPRQAATRFAELWSRRSGDGIAAGRQQAIFSLAAVIPPYSRPDGALRLARPGDRALAHAWAEAFVRDTGLPDDPQQRVDQLIAGQALHLWDDGEPRSMVAAVAGTPNGTRVGYVYTPPACRGRGYATAAVASLSQRLLDQGRRYCFLYTDLANPTSNAIYRRIGYRKICEVADVNIVNPTAGVS